MKKITATLLTLLLAFSLVACGGDNEETQGEDSIRQEDSAQKQDDVQQQDTTQQQETTQAGEDVLADPTMRVPEIDMDAIVGSASDIVWGKQDEATKQQMINEAKEDGYDVSFGADGSMTVVDSATGETMVQNPDGTWTIHGEDGSAGQFGGDWPENEFTKLLPKPDMELLAASTNDQEFTVGFRNATLDQVKAYVEQVKGKGFTVEAETNEQVVGELVIYSYVAKNKDGYTVTVSCAMGVSAVLIEKP